LELTCVMSRFEGCAVGERTSGGTAISIIDPLGSHTPSSRSRSFASKVPLVFSRSRLEGLWRARIRSDIFQFPFRFNPGTIEESVGMSVDLLMES